MVGPLERPSRRSRASERPSRRSRPNRARILPKNVARRKKKTKTGLRTLRLRVVGGGRPRLSLGVPPRRLERLERSPAGPGIPAVPDPRGPRLAPRAPPERVVVRRPRIQARARRRRARRRGARGSVVARGAQAPRARVRARRRASAAPPTQTAQRRVRSGPAQRAQPTAPAEAPARAPNDPPRRIPPIEVVFRSSDRRPGSVFASRRAATPTLLIILILILLLARRRRLGRRRRRRGRLSPRAHLPLVRLDADGAERKRPRRVDHVQAVHEPADDGSPRAALGLAAALVRMMMPARRLHARPGVVLVRLPGAPPTFLPPPAPGALHHAHEEEDDHHRAEGDARRDVALDAAGACVARRRRVAARDQARGTRRVVRAVARVVLRD